MFVAKPYKIIYMIISKKGAESIMGGTVLKNSHGRETQLLSSRACSFYTISVGRMDGRETWGILQACSFYTTTVGRMNAKLGYFLPGLVVSIRPQKTRLH